MLSRKFWIRSSQGDRPIACDARRGKACLAAIDYREHARATRASPLLFEDSNPVRETESRVDGLRWERISVFETNASHRSLHVSGADAGGDDEAEIGVVER